MTVASRASLPHARRRWSLLIVFAALVLCGALAIGAVLGYRALRPAPAARPVVWFSAPGRGAQVTVGEPLGLWPVAQSPDGVVRIELWADGRLQEAQESGESGITPFVMQAIWRPLTPGPHTLTARAFSAQGGRAHASVTVEALTEPDRDKDGAPDAQDACPDQPGGYTAGGCPDGDGDAIADGEDRCPSEAGLPTSGGCPVPAAGDRDGDGVPDEADLAADEPGPAGAGGRPDGDGDGVPDAADACPDSAGEGDDGCRASADRDDDGVPDAADPSPDTWGPPESGGCPDADGDSVCDGDDRCPAFPGSPEHRGCAELVPHRPGEADADGDGLLDAYDACPYEAGRPEEGGCPPPGEGRDGDGDGIADDEEPPTVPLDPGRFRLPGSGRPPVTVELDALEFSVDQSYDSVRCYACLTGAEPERVELEPLGERAWDIAAALGDEHARRASVPAGEPLEVQVRCGAEQVGAAGPEGGWGTYYDLGSFSALHTAADWDGHVITMRSDGGTSGHGFEARYRLCSGSCERAALPPPTLSLFSVSGDLQLVWIWSGDRDLLQGYRVYMNGSHIMSLDPGTTWASIEGYAPSCGSAAREFYVTAYGGPGRESPPSNVKSCPSNPCPRVVRVTFEELHTGQLGDDEWWADGESVGPIMGSFWAQGSGEQERLEFWGIDYGERWGERIQGFRLAHNTDYPIQGIFDRIWTWITGSMTSPYSAPDRNHVTVELAPYDSLSFGGSILDADTGDPSDVLFNGQRSLRPADLRPGLYTVSDRNITLTVRVDIIVGPEAGDKPDLIVTGVTQEPTSGQLRIHVFNNAADLNNADVTINIMQASTNEQIGLLTWQGVSIPSGGSRILQTSELVREPWDLRVIIDPDNRIDEMNDGNNIYETTVMMRVEFLGVGTHPCNYTWDTNACTPLHCNETKCPGSECDSEHVFWVWVGHGQSVDTLQWRVQQVRFPERGELIAYSSFPDHVESYRQAWRMEGNPRYTFDVQIPAGENLYIQIAGAEQDSVTRDDSMGRVFAGYAPGANWGARSESYSGTYGHDGSCDDVNCDPCNEGMWAEWRITRLH